MKNDLMLRVDIMKPMQRVMNRGQKPRPKKMAAAETIYANRREKLGQRDFISNMLIISICYALL